MASGWEHRSSVAKALVPWNVARLQVWSPVAHQCGAALWRGAGDGCHGSRRTKMGHLG